MGIGKGVGGWVGGGVGGGGGGSWAPHRASNWGVYGPRRTRVCVHAKTK